MITFEMNLVPYGDYRLGETILIKATISSIYIDNKPYHQYTIIDNNNNQIASGHIKKTKSGHQNPLHLLQKIIENIDINSFEENHIKTKWDKK